MEYWCYFHNYSERTKSLSDEDLGRLVRLLTDYSSTGECTDIPDQLRMAFDFIRVDIDQCHKKAKETAQIRKASAEKRWMQMHANDANACKSIHTNTKTKTNTKTNTKDKYGANNFDQKVVDFKSLSNFIE